MSVLSFESVCFAASGRYEGGIDTLSFALAPGGLAVLPVQDGALWPLGDLAGGVLEPERGVVLFEGRPWTALDADAAAAARARIGRVPSDVAWLSNLDVDENVTLPLRYHRRLPAVEALALARGLAERVGLNAFPPGRPVHVTRTALRLAAWVRALSLDPVLLVVDQPFPEDAGDLLRGEVERRMKAGMAVLWAGALPGAWAGSAALHFRAGNGTITGINA